MVILALLKQSHGECFDRLILSPDLVFLFHYLLFESVYVKISLIDLSFEIKAQVDQLIVLATLIIELALDLLKIGLHLFHGKSLAFNDPISGQDLRPELFLPLLDRLKLLSHVPRNVFDALDLLIFEEEITLMLMKCHHQILDTFLIVHDQLGVVAAAH